MRTPGWGTTDRRPWLQHPVTRVERLLRFGSHGVHPLAVELVKPRGESIFLPVERNILGQERSGLPVSLTLQPVGCQNWVPAQGHELPKKGTPDVALGGSSKGA